jgi:hypothetical protein
MLPETGELSRLLSYSPKELKAINSLLKCIRAQIKVLVLVDLTSIFKQLR